MDWQIIIIIKKNILKLQFFFFFFYHWGYSFGILPNSILNPSETSTLSHNTKSLGYKHALTHITHVKYGRKFKYNNLKEQVQVLCQLQPNSILVAVLKILKFVYFPWMKQVLLKYFSKYWWFACQDKSPWPSRKVPFLAKHLFFFSVQVHVFFKVEIPRFLFILEKENFRFTRFSGYLISTCHSGYLISTCHFLFLRSKWIGTRKVVFSTYNTTIRGIQQITSRVSFLVSACNLGQAQKTCHRHFDMSKCDVSELTSLVRDVWNSTECPIDWWSKPFKISHTLFNDLK